MKAIKKLSAFLLVALLMAVTVVPALAYTSPDTSSTTTTVNHKMTITESPYNLAGNITYKFAVDTTARVTVAAPSGVTASGMVTGDPSFSKDTVSYGPSDDFSTGDHSVTKNVVVDWSSVKFNEPGIYYWKVDKTIDPAVTAPLDSSLTTNDDATTYLWAYVTDNNGTLELNATGLSTSTELSEKADIQDQYPAKKVDLSVGKTVTGSQGSKDKYFKFEITLTLPANVATDTYTISGFDPAADVNASPYNSNAVQPTDADDAKDGTQVSLVSGENDAITVWLKHGQTVKIEGLPYGTGYSITETNGDYTVTTANTGDQKNDSGAGTDIATGSSATVADSSLEANTTVQYTNNKEGTTPTGILLQYGAPIAGILLAAGLFIVLMTTKRRKEQETGE